MGTGMRFHGDRRGPVCAIILLATVILNNAAQAQKTNSWTSMLGTGRWDTATNWSLLAVPTNTQSAVFIINAPSGTNIRTVTVDSTTSPASLTISNLTVYAPGGKSNILFLGNAGLAQSLDILNSLTISNGGALQVSNSAVRVDALSGGAINGAGLNIDGVVTLNLGSSLTATNAYTTLGNVSAGRMTLLGGTATVVELDLGNNVGAAGTLTVAGGQLSVTNFPNSFFSGEIFLGFGGVSQMTVTNGTVLAQGIVVASDSPGTLTVSGGTVSLTESLDISQNLGTAGTVWITGGQLAIASGNFSFVGVGESDSGRMTVSNGTVLVGAPMDVGQFGGGGAGTWTSAGGTSVLSSNLTAGDGYGATGMVWVTSGRLVATNATTFLGNSGFGEMTVSNGTVLLQQLDLGEFGSGGLGVLKIAGGTNVLSSSLNLGDDPNDPTATGVVWVVNGQLVVTNNSTQVGNFGVGQMTVSNGTFMAQSVNVGLNAGALGTLTVAGGTNALLGPLTVGSFLGGTGVVWVTGGQLTITNNPAGVAGGSGFNVDGSVTLNAGTIGATNVSTRVGNVGGGTLTINGGRFLGRDMSVGRNTGSQGLVTVTGGTTILSSNLVVGDCASGVIGVVSVMGGQLYITNATHAAVVDVRDGTITVSTSGLLVVDKLIVTNACGRFIRSGGSVVYSSLTLDPNLSAVGDGIPNGWKQQYGLDPFDPNVGSEDLDGDGMNNVQEFMAGTDPTNATSYFHSLSVTQQGGTNVLVTWMMGPGRTNMLQADGGTPGGSYSTNGFADIFAVTNTVGTVTNYLDSGAAATGSSRYYRVRIVP